MTKARHIAVVNYLTSQGALPYAKPVDRTVFGNPQGKAVALPPPFESAVVIGVARRGIRAWLTDPRRLRGRLLILRGVGDNDLDDLRVDISLRDLCTLTRAYYEKEDR